MSDRSPKQVNKIFIVDWSNVNEAICFFVRNSYRVWMERLKDLNGKETDSWFLCYDVGKNE